MNEENETEESEEVEDRTSEIEYRLQMADYYRAVMMGGLFPGDDSPGALAVEAEMRAYAMIRSEVLLGLRPEDGESVSPFTEQEVSILKALAQAGARKLGAELPEIQPVTVTAKPKATVFQPKLVPIRPSPPPPTTITSDGTSRQDGPRKAVKPTKKTKKQVAVQKEVANNPVRGTIGGQIVPPNRIPTSVGAAGFAASMQAAADQLNASVGDNSTLLNHLK